jgi:hypothetical protein
VAALELLTETYGWELVPGPDGQLRWLCRRCAEKATCEREGHEPLILPGGVFTDGRTFSENSLCNRCGDPLSPYAPPVPAPAGYPAPEPQYENLLWDGAAFPEGQGFAAAAVTVLSLLSATAVQNRWAAWNGDQSNRPQGTQPSRDNVVAAATVLRDVARNLLSAWQAPVA